MFHVFKWTAVLSMLAVVGLFCSQSFKTDATVAQQYVKKKATINETNIDNYRHLLNSHTTIEDFIKGRSLPITILTNMPTIIETDVETALKLEQYGIMFEGVNFVNGKVTATLKPYPPVFK